MKKSLKKGLALLAAAALLATSASAYAAQLPNESASSLSLASSSEVDLYTKFELSYNLTADRLTGTLTARPSAGQFRYTNMSIMISFGAETRYYTTNGPSSFRIDEELDLSPGDQVYIIVNADGEAFDGYSYIGTATGRQEFTLTL